MWIRFRDDGNVRGLTNEVNEGSAIRKATSSTLIEVDAVGVEICSCECV